MLGGIGVLINPGKSLEGTMDHSGEGRVESGEKVPRSCERYHISVPNSTAMSQARRKMLKRRNAGTLRVGSRCPVPSDCPSPARALSFVPPAFWFLVSAPCNTQAMSHKQRKHATRIVVPAGSCQEPIAPMPLAEATDTRRKVRPMLKMKARMKPAEQRRVRRGTESR